MREFQNLQDTQKQPEFAIFADIELKTGGNDVSLKYRKIGFSELNGNSFETLVSDFAKGNYKPANWGNPKRNGKTVSPLSLRVGDDKGPKLAYIAFRLSDNKKGWGFSHDGHPITVAKNAPMSAFGSGKRVKADGTIVSNDDDVFDCNVAYFVVDCTELGKGNREPFNIHLDIGDKTEFTSLIIDPDVGYPDGTDPG